MSDEFDDDVFGGTGTPSADQIIKTRDYLKRRNRKFSINAVLDELKARGFTISRTSVGRCLEGVPGGNAPPLKVASPVEDARKRRANSKSGRKTKNKEQAPKPAAAAPELAIPDNLPATLPKMIDLLLAANTSTMLAIRENRTRMAINIIIGEVMAVRPEALLVDMRATAALVDALTVGCKLSGGASIDIEVLPPMHGKPTNGAANGNGHDMVDVTPPKTALAADLEEFRRKRAAESAKRA